MFNQQIFFESILWGVKDLEAHVNVYIWAKGPAQGKTPPRP